ncbi:MAG: L-carnitine dehydrogenase [Oscillospiraceae bacterium]|nr:L-carnitine dehydrogenase [Oscillospiraceae bacterium]
MLLGKNEIKTAAVISCGVIGAGWAARLLWHGIDVIAYDKFPQAQAGLNEVIANSEPALKRIYDVPPAKRGKLRFTTDLEDAVREADYIQESSPEVMEIKVPLLTEIDRLAKPNAIIGSSTSGLLPTELQAEMQHPERFIVAHPFNPVYLLPLVEICGGKKTGDEAKQVAKEFYESIGMKPLLCRVEIDGFIADRLLESLWREGVWMVNDNVATTGELDDAIRYGAGLRWALMGTNLTYFLAGGKNGMRHFMEQFGPALKLPWCHMEAPELTEELIDKFVDQTAEQADGKTLRELETLRDNCLVSIMEALAQYDFAAGQVLKADREGQQKRIGG